MNDQPLLQAVRDGNSSLIQEMVDDVYRNAYSSAVSGTPVDRGAIERLKREFNSAFFVSCINEDQTIFDILLKCELVDPGFDKNICFSEVCSKGNVELATRLLCHPGVDPAFSDSFIVYKVCQRGHLSILKLLKEDGRVSFVPTYQNPLAIVCTHGNLDILNFLLDECDVDPSRLICQSLRNACEHGHTELVRRLLRDPRVDPSVMDNDALKLVARDGCVVACKLLINSPKFKWTDGCNHALCHACSYGNWDVAEIILDRVKGIDVNFKRNAAMKDAMCHGGERIAERIMNHPLFDPREIDLNAVRQFRGNTFLSLLMLRHVDDVPRTFVSRATVREVMFRRRIIKSLKRLFVELQLIIAYLCWGGDGCGIYFGEEEKEMGAKEALMN